MRLVDGVTKSNQHDNQLHYGCGHCGHSDSGNGKGNMEEHLMDSSVHDNRGDGGHGHGDGNGHCAFWEYHLFGGDQMIATLLEAWRYL